MNRAELKKIRKQAKMSQAAFGEVLGVSSNTIYQWESGNGEPRGGWDGADLKKKLRKIGASSPLPSKTSGPSPKTSSTKASQAVKERIHNTRPQELSFVHTLASTLLNATQLSQARQLLLTAKREGLDLDRLLALLGVASS